MADSKQMYYTDGERLFNIPCVVKDIEGEQATIEINARHLGTKDDQMIEMVVHKGLVSPHRTVVAVSVNSGLVDGLFPRKTPTDSQINAMINVLANLIARRAVYLIDECMTELEHHGFSQFEDA